MKKLIWHHNNRTGGTTIENIWRGDLDIFHCDKNAFEKGENYNYERIKESDIVHLHSNGICPLYAKYYLNNEKQWKKLISERMRMTVIRDPISKFESEWGSYLERKNGKMLPHVPNFDLEKVNSPCASSIEKCGFYLNQDKDFQININEWMNIYIRHHTSNLPDPDINIKDKYKKLQIGKISPFFHQTISESHSINSMRFFLDRNKQYKNLVVNLSLEFILMPRVPFMVDIMLANENLDKSLAGLIYANKNIKELTIFRGQSISFEDLTSEIQKLRVHERSADFKKNKAFTMDACNRQMFYMLNRDDYTLWQSAIFSGSQFLKSVHKYNHMK